MIDVLAQAGGDSDGTGGALLIVLIVLYFVPTILAMLRRVPNVGSVMVINLFLGWSLIGWVVALAMAVRSVPPKATPPAVYRPPARDDGIPPPP
jgi:hypothetical protein